MFDANQFGAMMMQQMNPMNRVMQSFADGQLKSQQDEIILRQTDAIEKVSINLVKAKADNAPQSVIDAYEKQLAKLSA